MVNNSKNDVKDNYTNDVSSFSWEIKKPEVEEWMLETHTWNLALITDI